MEIRAVIFDIGGVLLTLGEAEYRHEIARRLKVGRLPPLYSEQMPALQRGELDETELFCQMAGAPVAMTDFDDAYLAGFRPIPEMLQLAADLRSRGVRTAILSNTQTSHVRLMRTMNFLDAFRPAAMSCEIGARKPEAQAYRHVLAELGLPAQSVAYVDDVPQYVEAGAQVGLHAILHRGDPAETRAALLALMQT